MANLLLTRPVSHLIDDVLRLGHTATVCAEAWQVFEALSEHRYDAVVANSHPSDLDATRLAAFIHGTGLNIPFVTLGRDADMARHRTMTIRNQTARLAMASLLVLGLFPNP